MPDATRQKLLAVAIERFGLDGKSATGTRAIAQEAGVPMSAITYHFGGKEELYLACARHIAAEMSARMEAVARHRAASQSAAHTQNVDPRPGLLALVSDFVTLMMNEEVAPIARFVVREQMNPTPAFELLFEGAMRPKAEELQGYLQRLAGGRLGEEELRLRAIAILGQVITFRVARAMLMRHTGWREVGERETEQIRSVVLAHTAAICRSIEETSDELPMSCP